MIPDLDPTNITAIIVAAVAAAGSVFAAMQSRAANVKTATLEARKVDKDAALDQQRIDQERSDAHWHRTDDIMTRLREEITRLDTLLRDARARLEAEQLTSVELRGRVGECEMRIVRLKAIVKMLTDELRSHGIAVPGTDT